MTKSRLEAFSDGVLAIIITIMVLELRIPHGVAWPDISPLIPIFFSYILSFIVVGIYWGNHHHLIHTVDSVNSKIIWANLHLLFWLSLIPFTTGWMGQNNFNKVTVAVYAALLTLCGIAYYILLKTIQGSHPHNTALLIPLKKQSRKGTISVIAYIAAIPLAFIHPIISAILFIFVLVIWWIPDRNIEKSLH
ncbi:MAG: TMEM175 family protein [Flavisolibacter sp.]